MKHILRFAAIGLFLSTLAVFGQVPVETQVVILKAEDARDYDGLKPFIFSKNLKIQERAVLAAARIGDGSSVDALAGILENGDPSVRALAAFALGETEADHASPFILRTLADAKVLPEIRARAVEAAGKISAANPKGIQSKELPAAILDVFKSENGKGHKNVVLLALTAALRARPEGADAAIAPYLSDTDSEIVATALNTLARLRAKNVNAKARALLSKSSDPLIRANAARLLGAAEDKESLDLLLKAATSDADPRVRVSAIRSLGALKDAKAAAPLLIRGNKLLAASRKAAKPSFNPLETSELLEIATAFGRILKGTADERAVRFLTEFATADRYRSPEIEIAFARIAPQKYVAYLQSKDTKFKSSVKAVNAGLQGIREFAALDDSEENKKLKTEAVVQLRRGLERFDANQVSPTGMSIPDVLQTLAAFKPQGLDANLRRYITEKDVFIRTAAAGLLADLPGSKENVDALKAAFARALATDKIYDDAQLAILDALFKLDKKESVSTLLFALNATDYLVRKKAFDLLEDDVFENNFPDVDAAVENAYEKNKDTVLAYASASGTKLGQILNTDADYRRALGRKNGRVKAVFTTEKGNFTIDLLPDDAPLTVDNFIKLANAKYFNGLEVHRVVPNFVMQDGDPRGDGNGGPGWSIRCEINMLPYERGAVGMALSGKDTGGSQWFVTHSPQPHLDGGYTVFGRVNADGMKVVDTIVRGDRILSVRIIEGQG